VFVNEECHVSSVDLPMEAGNTLKPNEAQNSIRLEALLSPFLLNRIVELNRNLLLLKQYAHLNYNKSQDRIVRTLHIILRIKGAG
jgi:hypothetical protein